MESYAVDEIVQVATPSKTCNKSGDKKLPDLIPSRELTCSFIGNVSMGINPLRVEATEEVAPKKNYFASMESGIQGYLWENLQKKAEKSFF
ncbi:hypothetical protein POVCU2_0079350 [Plasmodium ovale curtisi]|uniref:Uncharacterized protein n=1 Tax=Plasmodium ovale curtisi TaxID=864141 RepID=A0A1A8WPA5_PLAOA|nr:hypothetical protein POVCU2_0079350 [Plasmodium ovale curtisi]